MAGYIVAVTGASGAVYGMRLVRELLVRGDDVDLIISPCGLLLLKEELGLDLRGEKNADLIRAHLGLKAPPKGVRRGKVARSGSLAIAPYDDLTAPFASGSALKRSMIICPCSMGTLARVAAGISGNLIERAADCVLKERGTLILVPRETPLNSIHLENMLRLSRAGAVILPAMPAFYHGPERIGDLVDFVVGKVLDMLGIENSLYKRWKK